jgi:hypothetical protein
MSHTRTLSKSDFKTAQDCPSKLYYKKKGFLSKKNDNPYMKFLAEGGYAVGKLATLLYPGGHDLGPIERSEESHARTLELLEFENVTIYEATVRHENFLVRVDVLVKKGDVLELIEVKSKSVDSSAPDILNQNGTIRTEWQEYIEDVAYQTMVLRSAFPHWKIIPYMLLMDKAAYTQIEGLKSMFKVNPSKTTTAGFRGYEVEFTGNVEDIRKENIMTLQEMEKLVTPMLPVIEAAARKFEASLNPDLQRMTRPLSMACNKCEYRKASTDPATDGHRICWGELADVQPNVLDFYNGGHFKEGLNAAIERKKIAFSDIDVQIFNKKDGTLGKQGMRPAWQVQKLKEYLSPELRQIITGWDAPLHFIDFETSTTPLPYHKGMRPYEMVAFQWSCHTVRGNGRIDHQEWINDVDEFPNFRFAESLMKAIGTEGTRLMWATHENTVLRNILRQMDVQGYRNAELREWLEWIVKDKKAGMEGSLTDMNALATEHYYHPSTFGKTSIKFTLPAALQECRSPRVEEWLKNFHSDIDLYKKIGTNMTNPYELLPAIKEIDNYEVREGTAAMCAYEDMLYGIAHADPARKVLLRDALLKYCKLDTLAMVIIWEHWRGVTQGEVKEKV